MISALVLADAPVRMYGVLTVRDSVTDYRKAVEITDAVVLIGMPPPWVRGCSQSGGIPTRGV